MNESIELKVGDIVEFVGRADDSCGECGGDRGRVVSVRYDGIWVYHLTMPCDTAWSIYDGHEDVAKRLISQGVITNHEARQNRFWWYPFSAVTKVANASKIEWIE